MRPVSREDSETDEDIDLPRFSKFAQTIRKIFDANDTIANAGDVIEYELRVRNTAQIEVTTTLLKKTLQTCLCTLRSKTQTW